MTLNINDIRVVNMAKNQCTLTYYERLIIEMRLRGKWSIRRTAEYLGRNHGVISREVKRNKKKGQKYYVASIAQEMSKQRAKRTNKYKLEKDLVLREYVVDKLKNDNWSPEEIAGRLKGGNVPIGLKGKTTNHESIYQYIYSKEWWLYHHLKHKKKPKRQKRYSRKNRGKCVILGRISIHERPSIIDERKRIGDWESDSMIFSKQKTALSVQYERKMMLTRFHLIANKTADETHRAISESIGSLPQYLWNSITFDNGGEGACHLKLKYQYPGLLTYFCDPYCSWQKGGVENTNKLIRYYLPRKTNLSKMTREELHMIQEKLNNRPRKKLGYKTPNEMLKEYLIINESGALNH